MTEKRAYAARAAGTDGSSQLPAVSSFVSRLLNKEIGFDEPVELRSIHRALLASWARREGITVNVGLANSKRPTTIRQLLSSNQRTDPRREAFEDPGSAAISDAQAAMDTLGTPRSIGVDIEDINSVPDVSDFRDHEFFRNNFSDQEIAYCIRQQDTRAAFCGLWTAKEALVKAGVISAATADLKSIVIQHDHFGRPFFPGFEVSTSRCSRMVVSICVRSYSPENSSGQIRAVVADNAATSAIFFRSSPLSLFWRVAIILSILLCSAVIFKDFFNMSLFKP